MIFIAAAMACPVAVRAQGLVAIQNYSADFRTEQPLTFSLTSQGGYDFLGYRVNSPLVQDIESW